MFLNVMNTTSYNLTTQIKNSKITFCMVMSH